MKYTHIEELISILYDFVDSTLMVHCMNVTHPTGPKMYIQTTNIFYVNVYFTFDIPGGPKGMVVPREA